MEIHYDFIIIGGGMSGLMCAYKLRQKNKECSIAIIEKGPDIDKRHCPMIENKLKECARCKTCSIVCSVGGAGNNSDGKFLLPNKKTTYGGNLFEYLEEKDAVRLIKEVDDILVENGATEEVYYPDESIEVDCIKNNMILQQSPIKHLGTDMNYKTILNFVNNLKYNNITFYTNSKLTDIYIEDKEVVVNYGSLVLKYSSLILAMGRTGSEWFKNFCLNNNIKTNSLGVDIGVRFETDYLVLKHLTDKIYEPKILYKTKQYGDLCRTFCVNPHGECVIENNGTNENPLLSVNGHSNSDPDKFTNNTNLALLCTIKFTEPFKDETEYAKSIVRLSNMIGGGDPIIQRFGDLINGRRSTEKRLKNNTIVPTLSATPGDLSLCVPKRQLDNIIEFIYALNNIAPGFSNDDNLLYGVEAKYYSVSPQYLNDKFEIIKDIYAIGDMSGCTRSLSQAGAQGLFLGEKIICQ